MNSPAPSRRRHCDLIIRPRWLLSLADGGGAQTGMALAIRGSLIAGVFPVSECGRWQAAQTLDLDRHLLLPGLINMHGHAAMSLLRGLADDVPLKTWLEDHIWPAEGRHVDAGFVRDGVRLAMAEMLRSGTTFFSDMYFFPEVVAEEARAAGMRVQVCFPVLEFPTVWGAGPDEYLDKGLALCDTWKSSDRVHVAFGPHAPYTVARRTLERIATLAGEIDRPVHMHLHETAREVDEFRREHGTTPLALLDRLGLLNERLQAVHMVAPEPSDLALLEGSGIHVVHCPESNLKLGSGFAPVVEMQRLGLNVVLGTDGAASNNDLDLAGEMRSAALLAKGLARDATALPALEVVRMATTGAARALGLQEQLGTLAPRKWADLIAVRLDGVDQQPVYDPVSQFVYAGRPRVTHAWCDGRMLLADGALQTLPESAVISRAAAWGEAIAAGREDGT